MRKRSITSVILAVSFGMAIAVPVMAFDESGDSVIVVATTLPLTEPCEMTFASGAGGWGTNITLNADGSFSGVYSDGELGLTGDDYPNGTVYICEFSGQFQNIAQLDETSYTMELSEDDLILEKEEGTTWIEDGTRYEASTPTGLAGGGSFVFYTPERALDGLDEDFLSWCNPLIYDEQRESRKTLGCYGLWNQGSGFGFFSADTQSSTEVSDSSLQTYLEESLAAQYQVMETGYRSASRSGDGQGDAWSAADLSGMLSGTVLDFDQDGQDELLTVAFETDEQTDPSSNIGIGTRLVLRMYEYDDAAGQAVLSAEREMDTANCYYLTGSIGYTQTGVFTYTDLGQRYIAVDSYFNANAYVTTVSVFQYDGSSLSYVKGAGYHMQGQGDYYVRSMDSEPAQPLDCTEYNYNLQEWDWTAVREYQAFTDVAGTDTSTSNLPITEEELTDFMDCYRGLLAQMGLVADDPRIGMEDNSGTASQEYLEEHPTTPEIYTALDGEIMFLSGMYTYSNQDYSQTTLERMDYQGTLDAFRSGAAA